MKRILAGFLSMLVIGASTVAAVAAEEALAAVLDRMVPEAIIRVQSNVTPTELQFGEPNIAGYAILGDVVQLSAADAEKLSGVIADTGAFEIGNQAACPFRPGLSIRFLGDGGSVDLLVCFACDEVGVVSGDGGKLGNLYTMSQTARDVLLGVAKAMLPDDEGIQSLPDVRRDGIVPPGDAGPEN